MIKKKITRIIPFIKIAPRNLRVYRLEYIADEECEAKENIKLNIKAKRYAVKNVVVS